MRPERTVILRLLMAATLLTLSGAAHAQSLFENFFGVLTKKATPSATAPTTFSRFNPPFGAYRRRGASWSEDYADPDDDWDPRTYRTVCVRMCDGYYWPISHAARRADFNRDARICASGCGEEARMFYDSSTSSGADTLVDRTGQRYRDIANAFLYRKTLIDGCSCKPMPWTAAEAARHQSYAAAESKISVVAGSAGAESGSVEAKVIAGADPEATETNGGHVEGDFAAPATPTRDAASWPADGKRRQPNRKMTVRSRPVVSKSGGFSFFSIWQ